MERKLREFATWNRPRPVHAGGGAAISPHQEDAGRDRFAKNHQHDLNPVRRPAMRLLRFRKPNPARLVAGL